MYSKNVGMFLRHSAVNNRAVKPPCVQVIKHACLKLDRRLSGDWQN